MKRIPLIILFLLSISLFACTDRIERGNKTDDTTIVNEYKISEEQAIASLTSFLKSFEDMPASKAGNVSESALAKKQVGKIHALRSNAKTKSLMRKAFLAQAKTKSGAEQTIIPDTLVYVVNFQNDGFAVLSADCRISSEILAVVESGEISLSDFNLNDRLEEILAGEKSDKNQDDEDDERGAIGFKPEEQVGDFIVDSIIGDIIDNPNLEEDGDSGYDGSVFRRGSGSQWIDVKTVPAKLTTKWNQEWPLNIYCPIDQGKTTPLGCGPVAIAQLLAYHEYPSNLVLNGNPVNWSVIKKVHNRYKDTSIDNDPSSTETQQLARFIRNIGISTKTKYSAGGSFTHVKQCKKMFESIGYPSLRKHINYREHEIREMIDKDCPVFIFAVSGKDDGHFWIIDGYKTQNFVDINNNVWANRTLFHCNWGWGGLCDGYYDSGIFRTTKKPVELGEYDDFQGTNLYVFKYDFRVFIHNKPRL